MPREPLPNRRLSETVTFDYVNDQGATIAPITLMVGYYPGEGRINHAIGEVFINSAKIGTMLDTAARDLAVTLSLLMQYGCTLRHIRQALTERADGSAEGLAGQVCDQMIEIEKTLALMQEKV